MWNHSALFQYSFSSECYIGQSLASHILHSFLSFLFPVIDAQICHTYLYGACPCRLDKGLTNFPNQMVPEILLFYPFNINIVACLSPSALSHNDRTYTFRTPIYSRDDEGHFFTFLLLTPSNCFNTLTQGLTDIAICHLKVLVSW